MQSLTLLFYAAATFLLGATAVGTYEGPNGAGGSYISYLAMVKLVSYGLSVWFVGAAVYFYARGRRA